MMMWIVNIILSFECQFLNFNLIKCNYLIWIFNQIHKSNLLLYICTANRYDSVCDEINLFTASTYFKCFKLWLQLHSLHKIFNNMSKWNVCAKHVGALYFRLPSSLSFHFSFFPHFYFAPLVILWSRRLMEKPVYCHTRVHGTEVADKSVAYLFSWTIFLRASYICETLYFLYARYTEILTFFMWIWLPRFYIFMNIKNRFIYIIKI